MPINESLFWACTLVWMKLAEVGFITESRFQCFDYARSRMREANSEGFRNA